MKVPFALLGAALLAAGANAQPLTNADARAVAEPYREVVFGETVEDPYRWMERADRADDVAAFIRRSSAHTVAQLAALPGRARLRDRIAAALAAGVSYTNVRQVGDRLLFMRRDPEAQLGKLIVREPGGADRVLYDPEAAGNGSAALTAYSVSPDGRTVAANTIVAGNEAGSVRFIDIATGAVSAERLEPVWSGDPATWLDDNAVLYTRMPPRDAGFDQSQNNRLHLRRIGGADSGPLLGAGVEGAPVFLPQEVAGAAQGLRSDWVLAIGASARADARVLVARRGEVASGRPRWREIGGYEAQLNSAALFGDSLYLITSRDAPMRRLIRVDLNDPAGIERARTIMPAGDAVLGGVFATNNGIYVTGQTDGLSRLFFIANGASTPVEVALPLRGVLAGGRASEDGGRLLFAMQDYFTAQRSFSADGAEVSPLGLDSASYRLAGATVRREEAVSADGTRVPMDILLPPGASGPLPMLLEGYGSYGANMVEPYYTGGLFGLLEMGGAAAFCGTRGGGERGRAWHESGREANKPSAQADLIACGERLVQLGLASPQRMTVMGTSAGGLLSPPAALRRPDLFGALVANVAVLNATRLAQAENGAGQFAEMGDPNTESGFRALLAQDAYLLLGGARALPDTLLLVGLNDRRVAPWMSAKFAARGLARFGDRSLVLVRTDPEAGHGIGTGRRQQIEQATDVFAFVLSQAGAAGFTAP